MRSGIAQHARSPRAGHNSGFSFRSILRNVSANASSLASTVTSAGSSVASSISTAEEDRQREQVLWASFDELRLGTNNIRHVLLLTYSNGFQVWDVEEADEIWEIVSKRDGPVSFLRVQPQPFAKCSEEGGFDAVRPLLLVVTDEATCRNIGIPMGLSNGHPGGVVGSPPAAAGGNHFMPTVVKFYSLHSHAVVHTLRFRTPIHAVRCSPKIVAVAVASQLYCFDAATLQNTFSVLTYPSPQPVNGITLGYGALAVGPRWLAYAANHLPMSNSGRISPQNLTPSPGVSPSTSPANGGLVAHYAKESSKQIVAGIVTLGDKGYKTFSRYCSELFPEGNVSPVLGSPVQKCNGISSEADHAGIVIVRDFVTKAVVAQFQAHGSPLSALCFDPSGTLLVTASIQGHNINVFRIMPQSTGNVASSHDGNACYVHLYKLKRGYTIGVIQDIAINEDSHWVVVSTSKGTNHLFAILPFGGPVGPHTHGMSASNPGTSVSLLPWWSNMGSLKSTQHQVLSAPPTVNLLNVSRIKHGLGGWREGAAASAASWRNDSASGAVAIVSHDGKRRKSIEEQNNFKEHLWVCFPSGHLVRYSMHLSPKFDGSVYTPQALDVKVLVEPLQIWDVSRCPNQIEHEVKMENPNKHRGISDYDDGVNVRSGPSARETLTPEVLHQRFLSNVEVQMHHCRPPIWAKPQISFHTFNDAANAGLHDCNRSGGECEIEKVQTRVVEVRKKDLVPVIDRITIMGGRAIPGDVSVQYGYACKDVQAGYFHRSSSGSSCASDGSSCNGPNSVQLSTHLPQQNCIQGEAHKLACTEPPLLYVNTLDGTSMLMEQTGNITCQNGNFTPTSENQDTITDSKGSVENLVQSSCSADSNQATRGTYEDIIMGVKKFHLQEDDADSTDAANSKSEDFGGEAGEDGWEGTMFPFAAD